jgi:hypothetical protein
VCHERECDVSTCDGQKSMQHYGGETIRSFENEVISRNAVIVNGAIQEREITECNFFHKSKLEECNVLAHIFPSWDRLSPSHSNQVKKLAFDLSIVQ